MRRSMGMCDTTVRAMKFACLKKKKIHVKFESLGYNPYLRVIFFCAHIVVVCVLLCERISPSPAVKCRSKYSSVWYIILLASRYSSYSNLIEHVFIVKITARGLMWAGCAHLRVLCGQQQDQPWRFSDSSSDQANWTCSSHHLLLDNPVPKRSVFATPPNGWRAGCGRGDTKNWSRGKTKPRHVPPQQHTKRCQSQDPSFFCRQEAIHTWSHSDLLVRGWAHVMILLDVKDCVPCPPLSVISDIIPRYV